MEFLEFQAFNKMAMAMGLKAGYTGMTQLSGKDRFIVYIVQCNWETKRRSSETKKVRETKSEKQKTREIERQRVRNRKRER